MLDNPDYEVEFYENQIKMMEERYEIIFSRWGLSWGKYYNYVKKQLKNKKYWMWSYLCGFEKFIQEEGNESLNRRIRLYKDADARIARIIGQFYKSQNYNNSL